MSASGFGVNCFFQNEAISLMNPALMKMFVCPVQKEKGLISKQYAGSIVLKFSFYLSTYLTCLESAASASASSSRGTFIFPFLQKKVYKDFLQFLLIFPGNLAYCTSFYEILNFVLSKIFLREILDVLFGILDSTFLLAVLQTTFIVLMLHLYWISSYF